MELCLCGIQEDNRQQNYNDGIRTHFCHPAGCFFHAQGNRFKGRPISNHKIRWAEAYCRACRRWRKLWRYLFCTENWWYHHSNRLAADWYERDTVWGGLWWRRSYIDLCKRSKMLIQFGRKRNNQECAGARRVYRFCRFGGLHRAAEIRWKVGKCTKL